MVETIRYSKIYADDIAFGTGTKEISLASGEVVEMEELNITHLITGANNQVLYASSDGTTEAAFTYVPASNQLLIPNVAGANTAAATLALLGTSHATPGNIILNASGGNVGIGTASPDTRLHVASSAAAALTIDATGADAQIIWALAGTETWYAGIDQSDSNKFKVGSGGVVGTNTVLTVSGSNVGVGATSPLGVLHVRSGATTSTTPSTDADDLVVEAGGGDGGISIVTPNADAGALRFARPSNPLAGYITYDHQTDKMEFGAGGASRILLTGNSVVIGSTTVNSFSSQGLTIDQGTNDDHVLSIRSSDVAHGVTDIAQTDTYCYATKFNSSQGGLLWVGVSEGIVGIGITGVCTTETVTTTDGSAACVALTGFAKSGTGTAALADTSNLVQIRNSATSVVLVKGDGDVHNSGGLTAMGTYDEHPDHELLQVVKGTMDRSYMNRLGEWASAHLETLERGGVVIRDGDKFWISQRAFRGLLIDAITQLAGRIEALERGRTQDA